MKKRELKRIARVIADSERVIRDPYADSAAKSKAKEEIINSTNKLETMVDLMAVDEMVLELLYDVT